jgi:hypothetical protein
MTPSETTQALAEFGALFDAMEKARATHPEYSDEQCFEAAVRDPELPSLIEWNYRKQLEEQETAA